MKKVLSLFLLSALMLSLCSCAKGASSTPDSELVGATLGGEGGGRIFSPSVLSLPTADVAIVDAVSAGNDIVMCGVTASKAYVFFRMDISQQVINQVNGLTLKSLVSMDGMPDGRTMVTSIDETGAYIMYMLFPDGFGNGGEEYTVLPQRLPQELENEGIWDVKLDKLGFVVSTNDKVYDVSFPLCEIVTSFGPYSSTPQVVRTNDGSFCAITAAGSDADGTRFEYMAFELGDKTGVLTVQKELTLSSTYSLFFSNSFDAYIPAYDGASISLLQPDTGATENYANLFTSGSAPNAFVYLSQDSFFGIMSNGTPAIWNADASNGKMNIKLATCTGFDPTNDILLKQAVSEFNSISPTYLIDFIDYAPYATADNAYGGIDKLNLDIIAGQTPDIYDLWSLSAANYARKGLLEELTPFFDSDDSIDLRDMLPALDTLRLDNGLYAVTPSFSVTTVYGSGDFVGKTFSLDDLLKYADLYGAEKVFGADITREMLLSRLVTYTGKRFVDYDTALCDFASPDFIKFLELSSKLPEEPDQNSGDWERIYYGEQLFCVKASNNPVEQFTYMNTLFDGKAVSVGFPGGSGNGVAMTPLLYLGMSSASGHHDGVWAFFKFLLSEYYQGKIEGIPITKAAYESSMKAWVKTAKKAQQMGLYRIVDGVPEQATISVKPADRKTEKIVNGIINSIDCINIYDPYLVDIIQSEAKSFYAGQTTAAEAASNIQNRASIYLSEQYG